MQLSTEAAQQTSANARSFAAGSLPVIRKIFREEGVRGFYKGLSASYLGVTEGTIQWTLYEYLKRLSANTEGKGGAAEWLGMLGSAGTAKCVASLITYPHEVRSYNSQYEQSCHLMRDTGTQNKASTAAC